MRQLPRLQPAPSLARSKLTGPAFWPYVPVLVKLGLGPAARDIDPEPKTSPACDEPFPTVSALNAILGPRLDATLGDRSVRFEFQPMRKRRLASLDEAYEARIAVSSRIPTRTCFHDFANALVWAVFPRAKRALADRQHDALRADVPVFEGRLPNARSEERDVLAMVDEGGLLLHGEETVVFGHAILEHLASTDSEIRGFPIPIAAAPTRGLETSRSSRLATLALSNAVVFAENTAVASSFPEPALEALDEAFAALLSSPTAFRQRNRQGIEVRRRLGLC